MVGHVDDATAEVIDRGDLQGTRYRLGPVAGCVRVGLSRYRLRPGERAMPVHVHADEEELFHVLSGEGLSWQDGRVHPVRAGDFVLHRAGAEAHTIVGAGEEGLDVLAFGSGSDTGLTWLPRAGAMWAGPHWLPHDGPHPFAAEAAAGPLELPDPEPAAARPATIARLEDMPDKPLGEGDVRAVRHVVGQALGAQRSGMQETRVAPGMLSSPPHCHSAEEELFYVLGGDGVLLLGDDEHPVRPGSLVARPAGTRVPHCFRAGADGLWMLAYSDRDPNDMCFYPRSGKVGLRGLGAYFRIEEVDYWDGEGGR
ncbi:MAG: cupin domain-containing protein [Solirubrobacteraceae bacterium]